MFILVNMSKSMDGRQQRKMFRFGTGRTHAKNIQNVNATIRGLGVGKVWANETSISNHNARWVIFGRWDWSGYITLFSQADSLKENFWSKLPIGKLCFLFCHNTVEYEWKTRGERWKAREFVKLCKERKASLEFWLRSAFSKNGKTVKTFCNLEVDSLVKFSKPWKNKPKIPSLPKKTSYNCKTNAQNDPFFPSICYSF